MVEKLNPLLKIKKVKEKRESESKNIFSKKIYDKNYNTL